MLCSQTAFSVFLCGRKNNTKTKRQSRIARPYYLKVCVGYNYVSKENILPSSFWTDLDRFCDMCSINYMISETNGKKLWGIK